MAIPSTGVVRASHRFTNLTNQELRVVMHAAYDLGASQLELDLRNLVMFFWTNFAGPLQALMSDGQTLVDADISVYNPTTLLFDPAGVTVLNITGVTVGKLTPPQVSWLTHWTTTNPRVVGSSYIPGPTVTHLANDGSVSVQGVADLAAWASNFLNPYTDGNGFTLTWGVWSAKNKTLYDIIGTDVADQFGTQRRRKIGVGS